MPSKLIGGPRDGEELASDSYLLVIPGDMAICPICGPKFGILRYQRTSDGNYRYLESDSTSRKSECGGGFFPHEPIAISDSIVPWLIESPPRASGSEPRDLHSPRPFR